MTSTKKLNLKIDGKLNEFSLPPATDYVKQVLGFELESGELDTALAIEIEDSEFDLDESYVAISESEMNKEMQEIFDSFK